MDITVQLKNEKRVFNCTACEPSTQSDFHLYVKKSFEMMTILMENNITFACNSEEIVFDVHAEDILLVKFE